MGLFDFVKEAGARMLGDEAAAAQPDRHEVSQERVNELRAQSITKTIGGLGLGVDDLDVMVDGDKAVIHGRVATQEAAEKITLAAGNQYGVSQVDCRLEVEAPAETARFYTVVRGDTLGKIAKEFYGSAGKYPVIFEANRPLLTDPDKIYPGQVLRIPAL